MKKIIAVAAVLLAASAGYWFGSSEKPRPAEEAKKPILYWYDPMKPEAHFDKPGKSPFMDMELVPKYAGEQGADAGTVAISPRVVQNLGVRTAKAEPGALESRFEAVGSVAYNERNVVQLQARAAGFVEKLYARAPLDPVAKGAPLVQILYPEWAGAQEEFLLLKKSKSADLLALGEAARRRLALLGMTEAEIAAVEREGKAQPRVTLHAPISGVVAELGVREGMTVAPGAPLFRIVDLGTVWVNAEVPEAQAALLRPGARVTARVAAYPGAAFEGRVGAILPEVTAATRTLRARIELANPGGRLKPGMFASLSFEERRGASALLVPSEAVIRTGTRDVVIVAVGEGRFRARDVEIGAEAGGRSEVRKGLNAGDEVVLSGQFLIDSEASLSAAVSRLEGARAPQAPQAQAAAIEGAGKVLSANPAAGTVELEHGPIPALKWPGMRMGFAVADKQALFGLRAGDPVRFELDPQPDADGQFVIRKIVKVSP